MIGKNILPKCNSDGGNVLTWLSLSLSLSLSLFLFIFKFLTGLFLCSDQNTVKKKKKESCESLKPTTILRIVQSDHNSSDFKLISHKEVFKVRRTIILRGS